MTTDIMTCQKLYETFQQAGRRPVLDPVLELVLIDCPHCNAQDKDPLGMWRPLRVVPRRGVLIFYCTACKRHDERRRVR